MHLLIFQLDGLRFKTMAINFQNSKDLEEMRQMTLEAREAVLEKVNYGINCYLINHGILLGTNERLENRITP